MGVGVPYFNPFVVNSTAERDDSGSSFSAFRTVKISMSMSWNHDREGICCACCPVMKEGMPSKVAHFTVGGVVSLCQA